MLWDGFLPLPWTMKTFPMDFNWLVIDNLIATILSDKRILGGNFTRNLNIHLGLICFAIFLLTNFTNNEFLGDRYSISIRQEFRDRQGQMNEIFNMKTIVSGTLPEFSAPPVTNIPAYEQVYRREQPGKKKAINISK